MARRTTRRRLIWRGRTLEVRHTPDYLVAGTDHVEVEVMAPEGAPLPITETGYRSHFLPAELVAERGGAKAFVAQWLDNEAVSNAKAWAKADAKWRQPELDLGPPVAMPVQPSRRPTATARPSRRRREP
jgi:hypothetical protein